MVNKIENNMEDSSTAVRGGGVSRTVQQLLERHGLASVVNGGCHNNNNRTAGAFMRIHPVAATGSSDEDESDWGCEPRVRPDPIGHLFLLGEEEDNNNDADGSSALHHQHVIDDDTEELSKLRCQSVRTEVLAEKFRRKNPRCADYPGLSFASSVFSSDTMMKFNIIKNELHNIMHNQLKRVIFFLTNFGHRGSLLAGAFSFLALFEE